MEKSVRSRYKSRSRSRSPKKSPSKISKSPKKTSSSEIMHEYLRKGKNPLEKIMLFYLPDIDVGNLGQANKFFKDLTTPTLKIRKEAETPDQRLAREFAATYFEDEVNEYKKSKPNSDQRELIKNRIKSAINYRIGTQKLLSFNKNIR